jgi:Na+-transporting methylmalonyl-CoA/oxaloacetate decarboxylase gamma subunit
VVWLVVLVVVGVAVVVLLASLLALLRGLRGLADAMHRLQQRAVQAQRLAPALARVQGRAEEVQRTIAGLQERAALRRAGGPDRLPGPGVEPGSRTPRPVGGAMPPAGSGRHRREGSVPTGR